MFEPDSNIDYGGRGSGQDVERGLDLNVWNSFEH
jgi:hypothetical protein